MSDIYVDRFTTRGKCRFCGKSGPQPQTKNPKYLKAEYGWIFKKVSIFRGDDEFLGKICTDCKKAGKLKELR